MAQHVPSRTFTLASTGLGILSIPLVVVTMLLVVGAWRGDDVGQLVTLLQVVVGSITVVATGGAGSMALRDFGSKGSTTSQLAKTVKPGAGKAIDPDDAGRSTQP